MASPFCRNVTSLVIALLSACGDTPHGDTEGKSIDESGLQPVQCSESVLDASGTPLAGVGGPLLFREDSGYYRLGVLASASVLESFPQKLRISREKNSDPSAMSVRKLRPYCQVVEQLLKAEVQVTEEEWVDAAVSRLSDDGKSVVVLMDGSESTVEYRSVRFSPRGNNNEGN